MQRAEAFLRTGELDDALQALNEHLEQHPEDDVARRLRAQVRQRLSGRQQLTQALADLHSLRQTLPSDWMQTSIIHERLGDVSSAIQAMQPFTRTTPPTKDPDAQHQHERAIERLIMLYAQADQLDDALALIRQQPRTWRWLQWEADLLVMQGDDVMASARYGVVLAQLQAHIDERPSPHLSAMKGRILLARAHTYRRQRQTDIARQHYQEASQLLADDPLITFNLGCLHALEGDLERAIALCEPVWIAFPFGILHDQMLTTLNDDPAYKSLRDHLLDKHGH